MVSPDPSADPVTIHATPNGASTVKLRRSKRSVEGWRHIAYLNCFGADDGTWKPEDGWDDANRRVLLRVYTYYGVLNSRVPTKYHWPGLGKVAGGTVVSGLNLAASFNLSSPAEDKMSCAFVAIAKAIFEDIAWQFEAYLDAGIEELRAILTDYDAAHSGDFPCMPAWELIDRGGADAVEGSRKLLEHEQKWIIHRGYRAMDHDFILNRAGAMTDCPHPYGRSFIVVEPFGDILNVDDRWSWIMRDMWPTWVELPPEERRRIIDLDFGSIVDRRFGMLLPEYLPAGEVEDND